MGITRRDVLAGAAAFAVTPAFSPAWAQSGTMTLVVPFPPGGSTDALARQLQAPLQAKLNRVVIVENKSGAAGSLGAAQVAKSAPDGSSWLVTFDSHAVIPAILEQPPLDVEKDLAPVFLVGTAPYVIAANADTPYKTFADVVAAAKAKPGSVKYASVGIGTLGHLAMTLLGNKTGADMLHVPYRGGGPAMNDVLGGHVDLIAGSAALITPQLEGSKLRPILQLGRERLPAEKALEWGLVNRVYDDAALMEEAMKLAHDLANGPTIALSLIRRLYWDSPENSFEEQLNLEFESQRIAGAAEDFKEGVTAFLEKRPAKFKGK